jgi:2-polyprenyl-3-methyl-5-hydroxy-6-metoxy-1,4-benzoquinol methylase
MPKEMAISGTHDRVIKALAQEISFEDAPLVLDVGAGEGALSAKLKAAGLNVTACDLDVDNFSVPGVECRRVDGAGVWPYDNDTLDAVVGVEVLEHIDGHEPFFAEAARVLKPGGKLFFTTPNVLSLKSRIRFLFTGTYYSFPPLKPFVRTPARQHISPFTLNRYEWILSHQGLHVTRVTTDRWQTSSMCLAFLLPFIRLSVLLKFGRNPDAQTQNSRVALFGRKLFVVAEKLPSD